MAPSQFYVARLYSVNQWDTRHYYSEALFSSYKKAYQYLLMIMKDEWDTWLGEIVSLQCDSETPDEVSKTWTFDTKGNLLDTYDPQHDHDGEVKIQTDAGVAYAKIPKPETFTGKYEVGNIVFVRARPWNKHGYAADIIGVIGAKPTCYEDWISGGNDKYDWDDEYIIYYIASGYLNHVHVEESGIQFFSGEIPANLLFLQRLSEHFTGKRPIAEDIWAAVETNKMFVEKIEHLPDEEY